MTLIRLRFRTLLLLDIGAILFLFLAWRFEWLDFSLFREISLGFMELAQRIIAETDPSLVWLYFILIILTLSFLTMAPISRWNPKSPITKPVRIGGRLDFWYWEMYWYYRETILTRYSILELKKLTLQSIALKHQMTIDEAEVWIRSSSDKLPPEIRWLFQIEPFTPEADSSETIREPRQELLKMVKEVIGWPKPQSVSQTQLLPEYLQRIETAIQYLESESGIDMPGERI